jgi:hypothetical protein
MAVVGSTDVVPLLFHTMLCWHSVDLSLAQVGFPVLLQALSAAFSSAPDAATAARLLAGLLQLTKLCGLLGLDRQCEAAVGVLATRSGVFNPAPPGRRAAPAVTRTLAVAVQPTATG